MCYSARSLTEARKAISKRRHGVVIGLFKETAVFGTVQSDVRRIHVTNDRLLGMQTPRFTMHSLLLSGAGP